MGTRLGRIVLLSDDIDRSLDFYRRHFDLHSVVDDDLDGFRLTHVGAGGVEDPGLWLFPAEAAGARPGAATGSAPALVLYVDSLDGVVDSLDRGGHPLRVPVTGDPGGQRYAHVDDPDGNEIVVVEFAGEGRARP
ncbi:VOC family protein [Mycetocola reblochoni]|uniref:VOC domain-containing protein n=2 Tax=Mycetocola reblochoni TaxID=331618 RepID=A0A1R4IT33_9MICO|nr:VOC family protein [Mycetocola reblochoni]RLP71079.1 VOC family protein [Mycetocola reblochoni]SJN22874.1 hypothetical protein FM119_03340 [Mycetocola reblochoni REB411]